MRHDRCPGSQNIIHPGTLCNLMIEITHEHDAAMMHRTQRTRQKTLSNRRRYRSIPIAISTIATYDMYAAAVPEPWNAGVATLFGDGTSCTRACRLHPRKVIPSCTCTRAAVVAGVVCERTRPPRAWSASTKQNRCHRNVPLPNLAKNGEPVLCL